MTESEIKIWNEAIEAAMVANMRPNGLNRIAELIKPAPAPGDLTEDELCADELLLASDKAGTLGGIWQDLRRLVAEVRRHRKEQAESPHEHEWHHGVGYENRQTFWCDCGAGKEVKTKPSPHKHDWRKNMPDEITRYHVISDYECSCGATKTERIEESK
ncbi:MAG: hypothetical protein KGJ13_04365 [Patescibacteria group bacterium]|nr:hypothetical protein [Patescibacteria group bacterium]